MDLMYIAEHPVYRRRAHSASLNCSLVRVYKNAGVVAHIEHLRQVLVPRHAQVADARGCELLLDDADQLSFRQLLRSRLHVPEMGMDPMIDVVLERDYTSGQAE